MKIRDRFLVSLPLYGALLVLISVVFSFYHLVDFNSTYMKEERSELKVFYKQIEWVVKPYLEKSDFKKIEKYCKTFADAKDVYIKILDENKNVIAVSREINEQDLSPGEKHFFVNVDKAMNTVGEIKVGKKKYYIDLTMVENSMIKTLVEAQYNIVIFFVACFIFLLMCTFYMVLKVQIPFNTLQKSVIKIAKGNLDEEIEIPESHVLAEFAISVRSMAQRLKKQILRLKQLEQFRKDFIANVSHEVKTPLTAISSAVELLETTGEGSNATQTKCLEILGFQAKRLNNLVNDILSLSDIEEKQLREDIKFEKFSLNNMISSLIHNLNISSAKVNFVSSDEVEFLGNEQLLEQAVTNLIVNALKYSKSEQIDVSLVESVDEIRIDVKDYGIGIEEEHLERIFERFYRVDKARSRETGGTGLGLAIVKNIAILHHGDVEVASEIGKGSTFSIVLLKNVINL